MRVVMVNRKQVLGQVVGTHREKVHQLCKFINLEQDTWNLNHDADFRFGDLLPVPLPEPQPVTLQQIRTSSTSLTLVTIGQNMQIIQTNTSFLAWRNLR